MTIRLLGVLAYRLFCTCPESEHKNHSNRSHISKMVRFTDLHRVYLQALLSRRFMPENVALQLYKRAVSAIRGMSFEHSSVLLQRLISFTETRPDYEPPFSESRKGLQSFVDEIGEGIAELGLQVTVTRDETKEGRLWICLVSVPSLSRLRLSLNHKDNRPIWRALPIPRKCPRWHLIFLPWKSATTDV